MIVANSYGSVTSSIVSMQVVDSSVVIGSGTGLRGDYYNNATYTNSQPPVGVAYPGTPTLTRVDPTINYIWGSGSPDPAINVDFFAVRWYGQVQPLVADTYTVTARTDDGVRVWVDNPLVIDHWLIQGATDQSGVITLDTNKHNILMEYFERQVSASAQLSWSNASGTISESIVPIQQLFPRTSYAKPAVTLTSPANGSSTSGAVSLAANVTTNDGMIAYVAFYTNQTVLATVTNPPYAYNWATPPVGTFGISAQVLYNASANGGNPSSFAVSGTNNVTVNSGVIVPGRIGSITYGQPGGHQRFWRGEPRLRVVVFNECGGGPLLLDARANQHGGHGGLQLQCHARERKLEVLQGSNPIIWRSLTGTTGAGGRIE